MAPRCISTISRETLTAAQLRAILDYDPTTGIFTWRNRADRHPYWNDRWAGKQAGARTRGYVYVTIQFPTRYMAHRLAWLWMTGEWPPFEIDHRNRDRSDNRWCNLRPAVHGQNMQNRSLSRRNKTGVHGVSFDMTRGKFQAAIEKDGIRVWSKRFNTLAEAAEARRNMVRHFHGEFARE